MTDEEERGRVAEESALLLGGDAFTRAGTVSAKWRRAEANWQALGGSGPDLRDLCRMLQEEFGFHVTLSNLRLRAGGPPLVLIDAFEETRRKIQKAIEAWGATEVDVAPFWAPRRLDR